MKTPYSALPGNKPGERAEVSRRHSSSGHPERRPERGKEERALHKLRYGYESVRMSCVRARWKQWRKTRTRVRELMKLGVNERHAVKAGMSRKAYPATQQESLLRDVDL